MGGVQSDYRGSSFKADRCLSKTKVTGSISVYFGGSKHIFFFFNLKRGSVAGVGGHGSRQTAAPGLWEATDGVHGMGIKFSRGIWDGYSDFSGLILCLLNMN